MSAAECSRDAGRRDEDAWAWLKSLVLGKWRCESCPRSWRMKDECVASRQHRGPLDVAAKQHARLVGDPRRSYNHYDQMSLSGSPIPLGLAFGRPQIDADIRRCR